MRLERISLRGISSAFPGEVDLDLRSIGPGLVALCGANGQGKTTLLESTPGAIFRQLPARNGEDPVTYATGRDSFIDLEYSIEGRGAFRARLNLDGPKRQTDALLQAIAADGTRVDLNDGKRSTYDEAIRARFPSFDLFINSSFAAQGRGDEFTRRKPSQRKDLFVEFLALQHYAAMAETASTAAGLVALTRVRLDATIAQLTIETAQPIVDAIDRQANELELQGGAAELRQRDLRARLADLEARAAVLSDQVAAYTLAIERVRTLDADLAARQADLKGLTRQHNAAQQACLDEQVRVTASRDAALADIAKRIAGNQQIRDRAREIRDAVASIAAIDGQLAVLRQQLETGLAAQQRTAVDLRAVEQQLAALVPVEQQVARATTDAALLDSVPCGGGGAFAACQFLTNATAAQARIADLEARLVPKAALADQVGALTRAGEAHQAAIADLRRRIQAGEADRAGFQKDAAYEAPLAAADARIAELEAQHVTVCADADTQRQAADQRRSDRIAEIAQQTRDVNLTIGRLEQDRSTAQTDLEEATTGHSQAAVVLAELRAARADWDVVTATLATVASDRHTLALQRETLAQKREALADRRRRLARVEHELLDWRDLAKALGKGGLPDLDIDASLNTITAQTNALLLACFGPRFSVELVTQVEKAGGGMKDEFTVRVLDNEAAAGGWRDIAQLSGGEKTIVQEALMSSIALYCNQRSPFPIRTLFRDETGAALDPENALRYVAMLRRVQEVGGYHHILFISHNAEAAALADAQIQVGGGQAVIVHPPFVEAA